MKTTKIIVSLLLVALLALCCFTGCDGGKDEGADITITLGRNGNETTLYGQFIGTRGMPNNPDVVWATFRAVKSDGTVDDNFGLHGDADAYLKRSALENLDGAWSESYNGTTWWDFSPDADGGKYFELVVAVYDRGGAQSKPMLAVLEIRQVMKTEIPGN